MVITVPHIWISAFACMYYWWYHLGVFISSYQTWNCSCSHIFWCNFEFPNAQCFTSGTHAQIWIQLQLNGCQSPSGSWSSTVLLPGPISQFTYSIKFKGHKVDLALEICICSYLEVHLHKVCKTLVFDICWLMVCIGFLYRVLVTCSIFQLKLCHEISLSIPLMRCRWVDHPLLDTLTTSDGVTTWSPVWWQYHFPWKHMPGCPIEVMQCVWSRISAVSRYFHFGMETLKRYLLSFFIFLILCNSATVPGPHR